VSDTPFSGRLSQVFNVSGRGVTLCVEHGAGSLQVGSTVTVGHMRMLVRGIEHPRTNPPRTPPLLALLVDATDLEQVRSLIGQKVCHLPEIPPQFLELGTTLAQANRALVRLFAEAGIGTAELEARWMIAGVLGISDTDLINRPNQHLGEQAPSLIAAANRRLAGEPLSRILGTQEFYGREFALSPATLDPRADTETLVDFVLGVVTAEGGRRRPLRILDLGTGTGCLLLTLLAELPNATGVGTDVSPEAIATASANAQRLGVADRCQLQVADMLSAGLGGVQGAFDLIVSNPPYIDSADIAGLAAEVRLHDPLAALDGGAGGLLFYRAIVKGFAALVPDGWLVLEIGYRQAPQLLELLAAARGAAPWPVPRVTRDLGGNPRSVAIRTRDTTVNEKAL
jgi:release factor glutamine methyltransferase